MSAFSLSHHLVSPVRAVSLPVTFPLDVQTLAAGAPELRAGVAAQTGGVPAPELVRAVSTVRHPVTHPPLLNAFSVGTLELSRSAVDLWD